ncbi:hypothetical protein ACJX0J_025680, partial [Zea mays]
FYIIFFSMIAMKKNHSDSREGKVNLFLNKNKIKSHIKMIISNTLAHIYHVLVTGGGGGGGGRNL